MRPSRAGSKSRFICDLTRNFGVERAQQTAEIAVGLAEAGLGVIGIGLGGDEVNFPAADYAGRSTTPAPTGCTASPTPARPQGRESVWAAIDVLKAERIGHGVRALEDPALVADAGRAQDRPGTLPDLEPVDRRRAGKAGPPDREPSPRQASSARSTPTTRRSSRRHSARNTRSWRTGSAGTASWRALSDAVEASFLPTPDKQVFAFQEIDAILHGYRARGVPN